MSYFGVAFLVMLGLLLGVYVISVLDRLVAFGRREFTAALISPLAEIAALLRQENLLSLAADNLLFRSAPLIALTCVGLAALVIPLGPGLYAFDPSIGLFYFIVVLGPFVVAMMNAGWSQNSKIGIFGTFRAAAYLLCYEVPIGFAAIGPVMAAESLSTVRIVEAQDPLWYAVWQPLGVGIYLVSALITSYRRPFDLPQADSELDGGVLADYSGPRLLLFKAALNGIFLLLCAMGVVLFFGGWHGPWLPGPVWFLIKTFVLAALLLWIGRFMPRLRHDQMLAMAWKVLLPASLVNVALVGIIILIIAEGGS
jgi:NADH-quinone oxidoreductase subunit H